MGAAWERHAMCESALLGLVERFSTSHLHLKTDTDPFSEMLGGFFHFAWDDGRCLKRQPCLFPSIFVPLATDDCRSDKLFPPPTVTRWLTATAHCMLRVLMTDDNHRDISARNVTPRELWYGKIDVSWRERVARQLSLYIVNSGVQQSGQFGLWASSFRSPVPVFSFSRSSGGSFPVQMGESWCCIFVLSPERGKDIYR